MKFKSMSSLFACSAVALALLAGQFIPALPVAQAAISDKSPVTWTGGAPKYVFMFIGDGMSYPQLAITSAYLGAIEGKVQSMDLPMTKFPVAGSATTFDSSSFAPDSASTATSLSTGHKTLSSVINMDETKSIAYETITEKLKKQMDWKIGIISTVNLNHATPAAYYAHQASRGSYDEISKELVASDFDYFAGGKLLDSNAESYSADDIYSELRAKGYTVATTTAEYKEISGDEGKVAIFSDDKDFSDDTGAMHYELDRPSAQPSLADYVSTGISTLENDKGFFMMVEGGKIDWAAHANDATSVVEDVIAFNEGVEAALDFYNEHPSETLILVTGDHETGGLAVGFAGTDYTTNLQMLTKQEVSFVEYDKQVAKFRAEQTPFAEVLGSIKENFGLMTSEDPDAAANPLFVLTDYELSRIEDAYTRSMEDPKARKLDQKETILYGSYEPFSVTLTHVMNEKAGVGWTSDQHTGLPVPVFAMGAGEDLFGGYYDNTRVYDNLKALTGVN